MPSIYRKSGKNGPPKIIWVKGMKLGQGAPHEEEFLDRIINRQRATGSGTVNDPKVIWVRNYKPSVVNERLLAQETIVRQLTKECGLSFAWIAAEGHSTTTTAWIGKVRVSSADDFHVTVRMGSSERICNLHGHIYMVCEDNNLKKNAIRIMREDERGIRGGKSPQLFVWGRYPPESRDWPRAHIKFPVIPHEILNGSILDGQERKREEEQKAT